MRSTEKYTLHNVKIKHKTTKAVLAVIDDTNEMWLPLSQIDDIDEENGIIVMSAWIAAQKGLID
jgi:hypothetical protein